MVQDCMEHAQWRIVVPSCRPQGCMLWQEQDHLIDVVLDRRGDHVEVLVQFAAQHMHREIASSAVRMHQ